MAETDKLMNGTVNGHEDDDTQGNGEEDDGKELITKGSSSVLNVDDSTSDPSGGLKSALSPSSATSPDDDEYKKEEDTSKTVTFASDIEVYDLSNKAATPVTVSLDNPESYSDEQSTETDDATDTAKDSAAVLPITITEAHGGSNSSPSDNKSSSHHPSDLPLPQTASEPAAQGDGDTGHKHFEVSDVNESELEKQNDVKEKEEDSRSAHSDRPLLEKLSSTTSDGVSGHSYLSTNQDTIGPLDNPSFLKRLQYSVSQAVEDDAGFGGTSNLDLANFQGAPPSPDLDGGWAWVVLLAAFLSLSLIGATTYIAGVLMSAILEKIEPQTNDISKSSWIGAVHISILCMSGPFVGSILNRLGARWTSVVAGLVLAAGLIGSSFATSVVQLIFTHGFIAGVGGGFIMNTMFVTVGQYFNRYRGLACGLLATGMGVGSLVGGNVLTVLFKNFGLSGTYLLWGGVTLHTLIFAMLLRPSPEERLRKAEKRMAKDPNLARDISQQDLPGDANSMMSGLNSLYSSDQHSIFSGRTNYSRRFQRYPSRLSRQDIAVAPLLKSVLHKEMSRSTHSIRTNRSRRSHARSNTNLPSSPNPDSKFTFGPAAGQQDNLSAAHTPSPGTTPTAHSPIASSPLAQEQQPPSPVEKSNPENSLQPGTNINSIPEHEDSDATSQQPPASPTSSRGPPDFNRPFRQRYFSGTSQAPSYYTSVGLLSHRSSIREQLQHNDLDNESLASTLVSHLQPRDALTPRYHLGSRSIPALMGSIASFPTALAIVKDDLSRIEGPGEIKKKTLKDHLIGFLDSLRLLRNKPFLVFICTCGLWALGDSAFFMYLPSFAQSKGSTPMQASSLYTGIGFGSMCGRFLSGLVASDSGIGPILLHMGCLSVAGMVICLTPVAAASYFGQMICAGLFGLYTGSLVPLSSLITIELLGIGELGIGFGFLSMFQGVGYLVGPPLGGIIVKQLGFEIGFVFAGLVLISGSVLAMLIAILLRNAPDEEDVHDSFDDLEKALRRISDTESEGEDSGDDHGDEDHHVRKPFSLGSFHSHHRPGFFGGSFHGSSLKKKDEHTGAGGDSASPAESGGEAISKDEPSQTEPVLEEIKELEPIAEEA